MKTEEVVNVVFAVLSLLASASLILIYVALPKIRNPARKLLTILAVFDFGSCFSRVLPFIFLKDWSMLTSGSDM